MDDWKPRRDSEEELINRQLPEGYWVFRHWGRWDLLKHKPPAEDGSQASEIIRTGIRNRWEVFRLARRHSKGLPMPYVYSPGYWKDIERGRSERWMRFIDFLRYPHLP